MTELRAAAKRVLDVYDGRSKPEDIDYDGEGEPITGWESWTHALEALRAALATPPEPEALRPCCDDMTPAFWAGKTYCTSCDRDLVAALATPPEPPTVDVARLARAWNIAAGLGDAATPQDIDEATAVVAEYARLATPEADR